MFTDDERVSLYQIKVNAEQAEFRQATEFPDLAAFAKRPLPRAALRHLQKAIWTTKRVSNALRGPSRATTTVETSQEAQLDVPSSWEGPRLCVDVTAIYRGELGGGIRRTCLKMMELLSNSGHGIPVTIVDGALRRVDSAFMLQERIHLSAADTYVVLDSFWDFVEERRAALSAARSSGALTFLCVYDLIQLAYPGFVVKSYSDLCAQALPCLLAEVDAVVTISRSTALEIEQQIERRGFRKKPIVWFHLGADSIPLRPRARYQRMSFLSIGTLEPKKGYPVTLDAFERVWAAGFDADLTIIGRRGWLCDAVAARILYHGEYGRRLFWLSDATDAVIQDVASRCCGFIQASIAEGFGIPIIEAAYLGLPIIASDIAPFRELAGDQAWYFPRLDSVALAERIMAFRAEALSQPNLNALTWSQAMLAMLAALSQVRPKSASSPMTETAGLIPGFHFGSLNTQ